MKADGRSAVVGNVKSTDCSGTLHKIRYKAGMTTYSVTDGEHVGYTATLDAEKLILKEVTVKSK